VTFCHVHAENDGEAHHRKLASPEGIVRELANNPEQKANAQYARNFQKPDSL
jgi:hypothetical protein